MTDQYTQTTSPNNNTKAEIDYQQLKEQIISRYNVMEERIIVQQNEIAKLHREITRLKNYIDDLQQQMRRRG